MFAFSRLPPVIRNYTAWMGEWSGGMVGLGGWGRMSGDRTVIHMVMSVPPPKKKSTVERFFGSKYLSQETILTLILAPLC